MMLFRTISCVLLFVFGCTSVVAQTVTVPRAPALIEHELLEHEIAIQVPRNWERVEGGVREIFLSTGYIDEVESTCMIRLISIAELRNATPEEFVNSMTKEMFFEMTPGATPDVHVFDTALLGGLVARRIVSTQPFRGTNLTYISHQALRGADIVTVSCYADSESFTHVGGTFGMIIGTTRFLDTEPKTRPTYGEVQRAWGVLAGVMLTNIVWYEECSAGSASSRQALEQAFVDWKQRNHYMDELRDILYKRAQLEGGDEEAVRLSNMMKSDIESMGREMRMEMRSGNDWPCENLLFLLLGKQFDASERHSREVNVVRRAVD